MFIRTLFKVSQEWEKRFRAREGQSERKASPSSTNGLLAGCLVVFSFAGVPFPANSVTLPERFGADASYRSRPPPPLVEGAPKSGHCAASEPPGQAAIARVGDSQPAQPLGIALRAAHRKARKISLKCVETRTNNEFGQEFL